LQFIIAGSMPMLYGLSHWFLVELCLIAIVCATIWVTSDAADMKAPSRYTILGALLGLGLLTKMSYPLYVLAPIGYFLFRVRKTPGSKRGLSASLLVAGAIALPWYMNNLVEVSRRALQAGSAETARTFATGEIFSASAIVDYIRNLVNVGPAIYFVSLLFLISILGRRVPLSGKNRHGLPADYVLSYRRTLLQPLPGLKICSTALSRSRNSNGDSLGPCYMCLARNDLAGRRCDGFGPSRNAPCILQNLGGSIVHSGRAVAG
jgi:4-amino-4-deoxy-L-arabinose transferase-like glycosyltransferase